MTRNIKMLDMDTARIYGITRAEEVFDKICVKCSENCFCDIQKQFVINGEHPSIVFLEKPFSLRCKKSNTREQLLVDMGRVFSGCSVSPTNDCMIKWLDRQAAITRAEFDAEMKLLLDAVQVWLNERRETEHARDYWKKACEQRDIDHDKAINDLAEIWRTDRDEWRAKAEAYHKLLIEHENEPAGFSHLQLGVGIDQLDKMLNWAVGEK